MRRLMALAVVVWVTLIGGVVTVVVRATGHSSAAVGQLASLLAHGHADTIALAVAPRARAVLTADHLQSTWDAMTRGTGPLRGVTKTIVVREGGDAQDEIELLSFGGVHIGVLSARRDGSRITGLTMVGGTSDRAAAAAGAEYALDLVGGHADVVRGRFDAQMASVLSGDQLAAQTARATAGLHPPTHVAAQVVVVQTGYTVVETYLVFSDGVRRIESTFGPDGTIAGLYIRPL